MLIRINKFLRQEKGQALVEMALIMPLLIMLLLGIVEFGRIFNAYLIVANGAREGARAAAVGTTDTGIGMKVFNVSSGLNLSRLSVQISPSASNRDPGSSVTVTVRYSVPLVAPFYGLVVSDPFPIVRATTMRVE